MTFEITCSTCGNIEVRLGSTLRRFQKNTCFDCLQENHKLRNAERNKNLTPEQKKKAAEKQKKYRDARKQKPN